jgi:hypothetical protein
MISKKKVIVKKQTVSKKITVGGVEYDTTKPFKLVQTSLLRECATGEEAHALMREGAKKLKPHQKLVIIDMRK